MTTEELVNDIIRNVYLHDDSEHLTLGEAARDALYIIESWMEDFPGDPHNLAGVIDLRDALKKIAQ